ncbi:ribonuclease VapC [Mycolicibacterium chitae]|uniref:Ribonuclease VapC n=1 Tax=Mycolicibacterium chitae TaxID=1792 RepID=A0A3S4T0V2_MYCCI|nr:type II toxin-antitoxin system VapC family toxin [Mycolicibacterium chitae]MCV7104930.1 type II toxin-antitoxin system VapC family toxin [Mycolicibacterium chitae]BBZ04482.1 ribonuclease VapC [Mycolicibacterium chitae]VEG48116.1 PilT domain-containing protein [Mycolicibacterium chitae]
MIVLDTNVVSELMRPAPDSDVANWVDSLDVSDLLLTAVTAAELMYGVARLPDGRRRGELRAKMEGLLAEDFRDRILPFDALAATHYADIVADRERSGRQISFADGQIAAICRNWNVGLATRNVSDFAGTGVELINPWDSATP